MEKEVSASVRKEEMALSETNCIKENKTEVSDSKMEPSLTNGSVHPSPDQNKIESHESQTDDGSLGKGHETNILNKLKNNMEENTNIGSQQNNNTNDTSFDSHESFNDNQEVKSQNQDDIKQNENEKELVGESDSNISKDQETCTGLSIKSGDEVEKNSILNDEVPKESEMETNEFSENKNNSESNLDIKMQMNTNVSSEYCTESQESQTKSSHNQNEVFKMETSLAAQSETVQNELTQSLGEPQSNDEHQVEANQSESTNGNQQLECIKEQTSRDAFDTAEGEGVLDTEANTETENQDMGLEKQIHEGIKTCEDNLESQTNSVTSDNMKECLHSQPTQTTNKAENANENMITDNQTTPSIDANVQNTSYYSSNAENMCTSNAETKYENDMNMERCFNEDRTNNGDVISDVSHSDPSAMTVSNDRIKDEEMTTETPDKERDPNMTYDSSKRNSPNTQQSSTTPPLAVPASTNDSSDRIKDDPYNFSEEEDVFSPQLPSRQFSSSNANIPGSDSNDPALERLKAENRSSGEYDDYDEEMGADGEPEDPDRLVIADENGVENRLKQEMTGSGYDPGHGGGQYPTQGAFPSNGTDPKVKGEKKERKKHNRFNGMSDEEVAKKILPDLITPDLDILIIGINPGMYAAFKGHHYAGPGNHFWKCMFLSGLLPRPMTADDDQKLLEHGIGFTNIVERTTKGTANLTRREIEEGNVTLTQKIQRYRPKIAVFNGKGIYEIFSNKKEFYFGKQPDKIDGSDTHVWVMPNSSARCAQLPRAVDKVPFYSGLKKFRDYLRGTVPSIEENEMVFKEVKLQNFNDKPFKKEFGDDTTDHSGTPPGMNSEYDGNNGSNDRYPGSVQHSGSDMPVDSRIDPLTGKKRRGRPPKPRPDGSVPQPKRRQVDENGLPLPRGSNPIDPLTGKKKRGRPKKCDSTASQGSGNNDPSGYPASKRESIDSNESYSGCSGDQMQQHVNQKSNNDTVPAGGGSEGGPPQPLPPFSPNFGRPSSGMDVQNSVENNKEGNINEQNTISGNINADHHQHQNIPSQQSQQNEHAQKESASQQKMSSSHNIADMHSSMQTGNEYDRPGVAARLHGSVDTNDARSLSSHSGHSDYHPSQQSISGANNEQAQHHLNSVQQQHKPQQHSQQHQYGNQYPYPGYPQISSRSDSSGSLTPNASSGVPSHHTQHYSPDPANGNSHGGQNTGYSSSQHHQHPSHGQNVGEQAQAEQQFRNNSRQQPTSQHPQQVHQQHGMVKTGRSDDVTTKSITGLESLVDQIPSLENDSGVYSANSGSQPDTPRSSMDQYSPATAGYHPTSFHAPGFPVPPVASAGVASAVTASGVASNPNHFPSVPSTSDSSNFTPSNESTNFSASGSAASAQTPTNFSVSSLMHNSSGGNGVSNANATPTAATETAPQANPSSAALGSSSLMPPPAPFSSDSFSVSSLTSSYAAAAAQAHDMAKYQAGLANNPYMSSAFGSSAFGAGSFLGPSAAAANSLMSGSMGGAMGAAHMGAAAMGMGAMGAYYGQYSQAQAAAANAAYGQAAASSGFPHASPYSHGLHMPNPGYPYSPYGQSPYGQSPYF